jgi:hypothetical protein
MRGRVVVGTALIVSLLGAPALCQETPEARIARGVALRQEGRDEAALQEFRAVWESSRSARALAQMALAEQALGSWLDAEAHLTAALADATDPWIARNLGPLRESLAEVHEHLSRFDVRCDVAGAELVIAGEVRGALPLPAPLRVATGPLTFTVRAPGHVAATRTVVITSAVPLRETVTLEPVPPVVASAVPAVPAVSVAPPAAPHASDRPHTAPTPTLRYVGYALLGTGVAALVVSGVFTGLNLSAAGSTESATSSSAEPYAAWWRHQAASPPNASADELCSSARAGSTANDAQVRDLCDRLSSTATIALASGIAGGALALAGAVIALTSRSSEARPTAVTVRMSPWLSAQLGGASVHVNW